MQRLETDDQLLQEIDRVSQKTLMQCMQDVFEDGPKRDRRLWLGDLRLQALANYATFGANDLVKKCLYLFAAQTTSDGQVSANVFIEPRLIPDDTFLADFSLFFIDSLLDYFRETNDRGTLTDLMPLFATTAWLEDNVATKSHAAGGGPSLTGTNRWKNKSPSRAFSFIHLNA
jgi:hypothetical protein